MSESCLQHGEVCQKTLSLEKRMSLAESDIKSILERQFKVEKEGAVMENRMSNIIETLDKIDKSIEKMQASIDDLKQAGSKKYEWIKFTIAGALITGIIGAVIVFISNKI